MEMKAINIIPTSENSIPPHLTDMSIENKKVGFMPAFSQ
jgi:hypothetical protein